MPLRAGVESASRLADVAIAERFVPGRRQNDRTLWSRTCRRADARQCPRHAQWPISAASPHFLAYDPLAVCVRVEADNMNSEEVPSDSTRSSWARSPDRRSRRSHDEPDDSPSSTGGYGVSQLQVTKDKVIYPDEDRLVVCPIPAEVKKKAVVAPGPELSQDPVCHGRQAAEVQFTCQGDEGKPTYALAKEYEGLSIDAASGKVTIDTPRSGGISAVVRPVDAESRQFSAAGPAAAAGRQDGFRADSRASRLSPGRSAFRLPLRVSVSNQAGESDELRLP